MCMYRSMVVAWQWHQRRCHKRGPATLSLSKTPRAMEDESSVLCNDSREGSLPAQPNVCVIPFLKISQSYQFLLAKCEPWFLATHFFARHTPSFSSTLVLKNQDAEAKEILQKVYPPNFDIDPVVANIREAIERERIADHRARALGQLHSQCEYHNTNFSWP